jgi:hypothetical protein
VREHAPRHVHIVRDYRLDPCLAREQPFEVVPAMIDDRPELVQEHVVDLAATALAMPRVLRLGIHVVVGSVPRHSVPPPRFGLLGLQPLWVGAAALLNDARAAAVAATAREGRGDRAHAGTRSMPAVETRERAVVAAARSERPAAASGAQMHLSL